ADGRAIADDIAIDQQPMKLLLAPAALERRRVQLRDGGSVTLPRFREGGLGPAEEPRDEIHHRRGSCAAFCGCASGARRYCGLGGDCDSGSNAPTRATQAMSGAARASTV